ncbi:hypothetical protein F4604DRAFT_1674068 [Suillus subluteus]|nr:hypothetical protein F4604DRAFT_1674068 [Suillus subluteus]
MYLSTMPKRKLFNVANLGSWAKSLGHSGNKEDEVPMTTNMSESPPSSPKKKKRRVTIATVLDPPPFVLPIIEPSPLCESEPEHPSPSQCVMEEASPPDPNINMASARIDTRHSRSPPKSHHVIKREQEQAQQGSVFIGEHPSVSGSTLSTVNHSEDVDFNSDNQIDYLDDDVERPIQMIIHHYLEQHLLYLNATKMFVKVETLNQQKEKVLKGTAEVVQTTTIYIFTGMGTVLLLLTTLSLHQITLSTMPESYSLLRSPASITSSPTPPGPNVPFQIQTLIHQ